MNSVRFLSVFVLILCMSLTIAGPARTFAQLAQKTSEERMKSQRSIRAPYSNSEMMMARGFGKRSQMNKYKEIPRETKFFDELLTNADPLEQILNEQSIDSFPIDWFTNEMISNPIIAKNILHRFVDLDKDGILTVRELLPSADNNDVY